MNTTKTTNASEEVLFDFKKIHQLIFARQFKEAEEECKEALEAIADDNVQKSALHLLGTCYYLQGRLSESMECFKKILTQDPKHTDAAISLSIIYNDIGKYEDAKKIYQVANQSLQLKRKGTDLNLDRKFALKHIEMGDLYFKYHRYDDALEDYVRASKLDSKNLEIRIKIAKVYAKKGFNTRAIQELQQICHQNPKFIPARIHLGLMHFSQGNVIDAEMEWNKALELDPHNAEIQTYLEMAEKATVTNL